MRRKLLALMSLVAMLAAGTGLKAQEVTIQLMPGWNWIAYPFPESVSIETAFGDFEPMEGDRIESVFGYSEYLAGYGWFGEIENLNPGSGYIYYSNRAVAVDVVLPAPNSQVSVATATPSGITATSAVVGGTVTVPEGGHVFLRGVCWGTEPNPDIDGSHTSDELGVGSFSSTLEGLILGATYYVRAYVVSDHGLAYGDEVSFTTLNGIPVVSTAEVTDITATTATCGGTVTDGGGLDITARGICWSTSHNPTLNNNHTSDGTGTGSFGCSLIALSPGTTYYVRAYATTMQATSYGEEMSFTTLSGIPIVSTAEVNDITTNSATCGGMVTDDGGLTITARGVCWSLGHNPTLNDNYTTDGTGIGSFSSSLTGLLDNTTYYVRAYATNSYITVYGSEVSFTTEQIPNYIISVTPSPSDGGTVSGGGTYQMGTNCTLTATANEGYTFTNWTENGEVVSTEDTYSFMVSGNRTLVANFFIPTYVDLGLPSGTLWATCNVGATSPEDYGDYFAWGETQPKDTYNWSTYQYCNGSSNTLTKYCNNSSYGNNGFTDDLTVLLPEDDAAIASWGEEWRMPTNQEWTELFNNTTSTLMTTQNGVQGKLFIASNGNSIFLPYTGSDGYWSSSLYSNTPYYPYRAHNFYFSSNGYGIGSSERSVGLSIRSVRSSSFVINVNANPTEGGLVSGGGFYDQGQSCTIHATANNGYTFTNWKKGDAVVSTDATYNFTVTESASYTATFTVIPQYTITVSKADPDIAGVVYGGGTFQQGQTCTVSVRAYSGYPFMGWMENGEVVSTEATYSFIVNGDRNLLANFVDLSGSTNAPTGAVNGKFTINSNGDQVYFSQGNLQYIGSANTPYWKFAESQWNYLGTSTGQNGSEQNVDRDLFGWGTSGYNHGAACYQPWSISETNSDYYAYGQYNYNLSDQSGIADWGYNPIINGGNQPNQWRTLTNDEWAYIINSRNTISGVRWVQARVNGVNGMILLPDYWSNSYYSFNFPNINSTEWGYNPISATTWNTLEQYGAVFLPAAGTRNSGGAIGYVVNSYWLESYYDDNQAWAISFGNSTMGRTWRNRFYGGAVRLVHDAE